jgi:superoxide reductase
MTKKLEIYKCEKCGNIIEVVHGAGGNLICCTENMTLLAANKTEAAVEKHIPVSSEKDGGYEVKVGEVAHPMSDDHYIEWIEVIDGENISRVFLQPGQEPAAIFAQKGTNPVSRAYCNLHGLWSS